MNIASAGACSFAFVVAPTLWVPRHLGRELGWTTAQSVAGNTYIRLALVALVFLAYLAARTPVGRPAPGRYGHRFSGRADAAT